MDIFLGGTCNGSKWRDDLLDILRNDISCFNPVVGDWTEECVAEEKRQRKDCTYVLYVITPLITGVYAIAELVQDSMTKKSKTVFCYIHEDGGESFNDVQIKRLQKVSDMVEGYGAIAMSTLGDVACFFNAALMSRKQTGNPIFDGSNVDPIC